MEEKRKLKEAPVYQPNPYSTGVSYSLRPDVRYDVTNIDPRVHVPGTVPAHPPGVSLGGQSPEAAKQRRLAQLYGMQNPPPLQPRQIPTPGNPNWPQPMGAPSNPGTVPARPTAMQNTGVGPAIAPPTSMPQLAPGNFAMPGAQQSQREPTIVLDDPVDDDTEKESLVSHKIMMRDLIK